MKIIKSTKIILNVLLFALLFTACSKSDSLDSAPIYISGVSLIQASPTTEKLDVYISNTRASKDDFSFGEKTDYLNVYSGSRTFTLTKKNSATPLTSAPFTLEATKGYSLFVIDKLENVKFLLLTDDLILPESGKAKVRFVNLSPDGGTLNLAIAGKTTDLATNKAFKDYSSFELVDAAEKVTFNIKNGAGLVEATLPDVKIESGKIYTIWTKGLKSAIDDTKFGAAIFTHK